MTTTPTIPSRFYSLDALRGTLTFFIILFHWQHFFYDGGSVSAEFIPSAQPLFDYLKPLYTQGVYAVDFFFSLSGFIFFWLYGEAIASGRVSAAKYTALRVSRLYPLHLVTLAMVIVGQFVAAAQTGGYVVYQENDWYHLFLNLLFVNAWGFESGFSFNGPSWTVSIEVMMYIAFFLVAYLKLARSLIVALAIAIAGFLIEKHVNHMIGMGFHSFFIGGVVYILYTRLLAYNLKTVLLALTPVCLTIWSIAVIDMYTGIAPDFKAVAPQYLHGAITTMDSSLYATVVLIPFTILFLAIAETLRGRLARRMHVLGDMSYALYLLHFPLQLTMILVADALGIDRSVFYSVGALLLFYLILFPMSYCSYYYFELPAQRYLRRKLIPRKD